MLKIAVFHQFIEDGVLNPGEFPIELILQRRQRDFRQQSIPENSGEQKQFVRLQALPLGRLLFHVEDIFLVGDQPHQVLALFFFDGQVAAHGHVHDGRGNVAHGRSIVHQRAGFGGSHPGRRRVLHGDRADARIAPACVPQPEHKDEDGNREK